MRKLFLSGFVLVLIVSAGWAQNVLFIGNSFTHQPRPTGVNGLVQGIAAAKGREMKCVAVAPGGKDWGFHCANPDTLKALDEGPWDFVVLQNYSTAATHVGDPEAFQVNGKKLAELIAQKSPKAVIVLYETWARHPENGFYFEAGEGKKFDSPAQMMDEIRQGYAKLFQELKQSNPEKDIRLAKVGTAFEQAMQEQPPLPIYGKDYYHASPAGSYLSALVIYAAVTGESPVGATNKLDEVVVDAALAKKLQMAAEIVGGKGN